MFATSLFQLFHWYNFIFIFNWCFCQGVFCLEGFVPGGFCPFPLLSEYICYSRELNITLNFMFHMYDKNCISVTSHALYPLPPVTNCHTFSDPLTYFMDGPLLSLVTIALLFMPKVELAFFDASAHYPEGLCTFTPKSLSLSPTFKTLPPISHGKPWHFLPMCITEHFSKLKSICQHSDHQGT